MSEYWLELFEYETYFTYVIFAVLLCLTRKARRNEDEEILDAMKLEEEEEEVH